MADGEQSKESAIENARQDTRLDAHEQRITRLEDGQGVFTRATVANVQGKLGRCGQNAQTVVGRVVEEVVRVTKG